MSRLAVAKTNKQRQGEGEVSMKLVEKMGLADFSVLRKCEGAARSKRRRPVRRKNADRGIKDGRLDV
jgi:hypothetical protein